MYSGTPDRLWFGLVSLAAAGVDTEALGHRARQNQPDSSTACATTHVFRELDMGDCFKGRANTLSCPNPINSHPSWHCGLFFIFLL